VLDHRRHERRDQQQRRADVDRVHPVDQLGVVLGDRQPLRVCGVVDEHVDAAAEPGAGRRREPLRRVGVRQVDLEHDRIVRQPGRDLTQRLHAASRQRHPRAGAVKRHRGGGADPT